jgi:hypothetical protein
MPHRSAAQARMAATNLRMDVTRGASRLREHARSNHRLACAGCWWTACRAVPCASPGGRDLDQQPRAVADTHPRRRRDFDFDDQIARLGQRPDKGRALALKRLAGQLLQHQLAAVSSVAASRSAAGRYTRSAGTRGRRCERSRVRSSGGRLDSKYGLRLSCGLGASVRPTCATTGWPVLVGEARDDGRACAGFLAASALRLFLRHEPSSPRWRSSWKIIPHLRH